MNQAKPNSRVSQVIALVFLSLATVCLAQTTGPGLSTSGALIKLQVKPYADRPRQGLSRKRLFLIKGSRDQNKTFLESLSARSLITRDCFYTNVGATNQLIGWLKENDCETVYCAEIDEKYLEGDRAVPEFKEAFAEGVKELGNRNLARAWLTVNLPDKFRNGFYLTRQKALQDLLKEGEAASGAGLLSVMTDSNGTAYFVNVSAGDYVIASLVPIEMETMSALFSCEISIKPDDLGTEKPIRVQKQNKKCEVIEKPLPVCKPAAAGASGTPSHVNTHRIR